MYWDTRARTRDHYNSLISIHPEFPVILVHMDISILVILSTIRSSLHFRCESFVGSNKIITIISTIFHCSHKLIWNTINICSLPNISLPIGVGFMTDVFRWHKILLKALDNMSFCNIIIPKITFMSEQNMSSSTVIIVDGRIKLKVGISKLKCGLFWSLPLHFVQIS